MFLSKILFENDKKSNKTFFISTSCGCLNVLNSFIQVIQFKIANINL